MKTFAAALAFAWFGLALATAPARAETQIIDSAFGVFGTPGTSEPAFTPTNFIRLADKPHYGWMMRIKTDKPTVHWREEFTLPGPASQWNTQGTPTVVGGDRKTAVTDREIAAPANGIILNVWDVADGDPKGRYRIKVTVEGAGDRTFEFDVQ